MSSARTLRLIEDAYRNDDIHSARNAMNEYYQNHCLHPLKVNIRDSHTGNHRTILVGCGRCYHCMESKINEWCTRMYAHAEDFKNVYFVTLTYRSITNSDLPANRLLLSKLSQAIWHYDAFNSTKHMSYNPCLLVKSHYQNFLKRLRKNTGYKDISYVLSGEYGSKYGRPHFHMILFTNNILTYNDIRRAWSVCLWKSDSGVWSYRTNQKNNGRAFDFPIGNADFHDLVSNGTFNTTAKIKVDGTFMNAANCFAYVAKYVVKRDKPNLSRVRLAYRNLYHTERKVDIFGNEVSYSIALAWLMSRGYSRINAETIYNSNLKQLSYDKIIFQPSQTVFEHGILRSRVRKNVNFTFSECLLPEAYIDFKCAFSPFCEFSRGTPIGSVYATRNISEFAQGVFTKPLLQNCGFVVPSYFRFKARNYLYRFREVHKTIQSNCFAFGSLLDLHRRIQEYNSSGSLVFPIANIKDSCNYWSKDIYNPASLFADAYTGERIVFDKYNANYWKFDRSKRDYVPTRSVPLPDFIRFLSCSLADEFTRAAQFAQLGKDNMRLRERSLLIMSDFGDDEHVLTTRYKIKQDEFLHHRQAIYNEHHNSAE